MAYRLLENGADINSEGDFHDNALQAAAALGLENMVNLLLQNGADVNAYRGRTSTLQVASGSGHVRVVKSLLAYGAVVNARGLGCRNRGYSTALQAACVSGHLDVVKLLLGSGADVNSQGGEFGSALQAASLIGCDKIVQLLLGQRTEINAPKSNLCDEALDATFHKNSFDCPLHHNRENVVPLLLEKCDDLSVQHKRYGKLLRNAARAGFENVVKRLLTTDLENIARDDGKTYINTLGEVYGGALKSASGEGHDTIVQMLLDRCLDLDVLDGSCSRALQAASKAGHIKTVQILLQNTINAGVGGTINATAFDIAFQWGFTDILETLLKSHCKETVADEHGCSSEAYLVVCRGLTPQIMSRYPTRQYDFPTITFGQMPSRFVEAVPHSGLSFNNDGLEIIAGM